MARAAEHSASTAASGAAEEELPITTVESLVDTIFTQRALAFLQTGKVRNKDGKDNPTGERAQPFKPETIHALALHLTNAGLTYLNTKGDPLDTARPLPAHIDTTHPIGPFRTNQTIIMSLLSRLLQAAIRQTYQDTISQEGEKKDKYIPGKVQGNAYMTTYAYKLMMELGDHKDKDIDHKDKDIDHKDILSSHLAGGKFRDLYGETAEAIRTTSKLPPTLFDSLIQILIEEMMYCGIATQVIDLKTEEERSEQKSAYLRRRRRIDASSAPFTIPLEKTPAGKTWSNADKDGNPLINHERKLAEKLGEKLQTTPFVDLVRTLMEILEEEDTPREARRSCTKKKGVDGLEDLLGRIASHHIKGFAEVTLADFQSAKKIGALQQWVIHTCYTGGKETDSPTNFSADFLLDIVGGLGMVLSDFPSPPKSLPPTPAESPADTSASGAATVFMLPEHNPGKTLLYQLLFITKAIHQLLKDHHIQTGKINNGQVFLPLCEDKDSIEHFQATADSIYDDIRTQMISITGNTALSKDEKKVALKELFATFIADIDGKKYFSIGLFIGPSDLTKLMGTTAHFEMVNAIACAFTHFRTFKAEILERLKEFPDVIAQLGLNEIDILAEYGGGTALRRGAKASYPIGTTRQGIAASADRGGDKIRNTELQTGDLTTVNLEGLQEYTQQHQDYVVGAAQAHCFFFVSNPQEKLGIIVEWSDSLIKNPLLKVALKNYLNNQGSRGAKKPGEPYEHTKTEATRAIEDAATKTLFGLIVECPFPLKEQINASIPNFKEFVEQPLGLMMFMQALNQMVTVDSTRARLFQCPEALLTASSDYLHDIAWYLSSQLGVQMDEDKEKFKENSKFRLELAQQLVTQLLEQDVVSHPTLRKRLELFREQLPLLQRTSQLLTTEMQSFNRIIQTPSRELEWVRQHDVCCSNAAALLHMLTNFNGTPMQLMLPVADCKGTARTASTVRTATEPGTKATTPATDSASTESPPTATKSMWDCRTALLQATATTLQRHTPVSMVA